MTAIRFLIVCLVMVSLSMAPDLATATLEVKTVSKSIVRVQVYDNNRIKAKGAGFVVNEAGHVLTGAHLLKGAGNVFVVSLETGAKMRARRMHTDLEMNLAVLEVPGLKLPPLRLSEQGAEVGRIVLTLRFYASNKLQLSQGIISGASAAAAYFLSHNAMIKEKDFGMPLFNECDQVVALNLPDPKLVKQPWLPLRFIPGLSHSIEDPEDVVYALRAGDIITKLSEWKVSHTVVKEACLSNDQRLDEEKGLLEEEKERLEEELKRLEEEKEEELKRLEEEKEAELKRLEEEKEEELKRLKEEKEWLEAEKRVLRVWDEAEKKRIQENYRRTLKQARELTIGQKVVGIVGGIVGGIVIWGGVTKVVRFFRRRLRWAPFKCWLKGQDETGQQHDLDISAEELGAPDGVTIGRRDDLKFIINHDAISREHIRLTCDDGYLQVQDLGSKNGTWVNDQRLNPRTKTRLHNGDQLVLGPVRLMVHLWRVRRWGWFG